MSGLSRDDSMRTESLMSIDEAPAHPLSSVARLRRGYGTHLQASSSSEIASILVPDAYHDTPPDNDPESPSSSLPVVAMAQEDGDVSQSGLGSNNEGSAEITTTRTSRSEEEHTSPRKRKREVNPDEEILEFGGGKVAKHLGSETPGALLAAAGPSRLGPQPVAADDSLSSVMATIDADSFPSPVRTSGGSSLARLLNPAEGSSDSIITDPPESPSKASDTSVVTSEPLSAYTCPICFSPPSYATLTPCGHVCCGECLFAAVRSTIQRAAYHGPAALRAKCPICRAPIPGWDGRGGGVIGLKPRVLYNV